MLWKCSLNEKYSTKLHERNLLIVKSDKHVNDRKCIYLAHVGYSCLVMTEVPDCPPTVVLEMNNTEAYEGTTARLKCKFYGQPTPKVMWLVLNFIIINVATKCIVRALALPNGIPANRQDTCK